MLAIGVIFKLTNSNNTSSDIIPSGDIQGPAIVVRDAGDVTINLNIPDTAAKEAIQESGKKPNETDHKVELTEDERRLLKDLAQTASAIEKLPDGRTKTGLSVSGTPSVVIDEHNASAVSFKSGDYTGSLAHSQNAIKAYEDTKKMIGTAMITGNLTSESVGTMYRLGAMAAQRLRKIELAYQYAEKSVEADAKPRNIAVLATTLHNLGKHREALDNIEEALKGEPHNSEFVELRRRIAAAHSKQ